MDRATPSALELIRIAGANPLDLVEEHRLNGTGRSQIPLPRGGEVEITTDSEFTCIHLKSECIHVSTCPRNLCRKFSR
jgi:hypothetical protein